MKNNDPDFPIRLEKAIKEKYESEAIVNPHSMWNKQKEEEYLAELKEVYGESSKGDLISEKLFSLKESKTCKICNTYRPKLINKIYFIKYDCCSYCYYDYVIDREERWLQGWRPEIKQKEE